MGNAEDVIAPLANFALVTAFDANVSASTDPFGNPPTANPVILPSPLIVTGLRLFPHQYLYDSPRTS